MLTLRLMVIRLFCRLLKKVSIISPSQSPEIGFDTMSTTFSIFLNDEGKEEKENTELSQRNPQGAYKVCQPLSYSVRLLRS